MSSIEKFVDKLGKKATSGDAGKQEPSFPVSEQDMQTTAAQTPGRPSRSASREVIIDFERIAALGMLTLDQSKNQLAEEYRAIKRPLLNNAFGKTAANIPHANLIMVTSALPGEGKSFSAINLAISMATEMDRTVLLVEADVAKPAVCQYLGVPEPEKGLVDYLAEPNLDISDLMLKTNVPKLSILPAGRRHTHSTELLASTNMRNLMDELSQRYPDRVVIFDTPPLLLTSEAAVLAGLMGQVVLVVEAGKTPQPVVKDAVALLAPNQIVGVLLNKSERGIGTGYGLYGYGAYGGYGGGV
ncbi:MAG: XrtA-associated tyrosine autokinase [Gammaproteobacteria bacterium]|nr:XrtA-associated tyrosine autokinase [Gammaproteobacteria bacterium]